MNADAMTKDCWILGQLAGIQMLEQELKVAFTMTKGKPGDRSREELRARVAHLKSWVSMVDEALSVRTPHAA